MRLLPADFSRCCSSAKILLRAREVVQVPDFAPCVALGAASAHRDRLLEGSRGSDPRLLGPTVGESSLTAHVGSDPVRQLSCALGLDQPFA
jgi:hypothetical protein